MYKICFYVPIDSAEKVKQAVFKAGAGKIGNYDHCCWQIKGTGQFRPLVGSKPTIGEINNANSVEEYKVELVCEDYFIKNTIDALIKSHPYEEPAYQYWKINGSY